MYKSHLRSLHPPINQSIMYKRPVQISGNSINTDSCSSSGSITGKICRICHFVEKTGDRKLHQGIRNKKEKGPSVLHNFFKQFLISAPEIDEDELIAPCECRGTMRHVHRGCLNQWRSASPRSDSFTRCEQCFAAYTFKHTWVTAVLSHPVTIYSLCTLLFVAWIAASTFVSTGAMNHPSTSFNDNNNFTELFNLLPTIEISEKLFFSQLFIPFKSKSFLSSINRLFYGLIFVALTEYIFFTPSFILSFNTLFCIWRIQKYELFFDKWLLLAFVGFGLWRAGKSLNGMIEAATSRIVKLKLLEVCDNDLNVNFNFDANSNET